MDDPRISQSVNSALQPVQPGKKSAPAAGHSQAPAESTTVAGSSKGKEVSREDFASIGDAAIKDMTDLLPLEILSSPGLRQAEWAWRQIITDALAKWSLEKSQLSQFYSRAGKIQNQAENVFSQISENVMQGWWQTLSKWAQSVRQNTSNTAFGRTIPQVLPMLQETSGLLPFSQVTAKTYQQLSTASQHEILLDRVLSAVTSENMPQMGSGIFTPQLSDQSTAEEPVHWYAERTARHNRHGQVLDRLSIQFSLHDWPVEIVFLSAKPTLYVHVRSDHPNVHKLTSSARPVLFEKLQKTGWRLEQWSVSQWTQEGEE